MLFQQTRQVGAAITGAVASTALLAAQGNGRQIRVHAVTVTSGLTTSPRFRVQLTDGDGGTVLWQGEVDAVATSHLRNESMNLRTRPNVGLFYVVDQVTNTPSGRLDVQLEVL